MNTFRLARTAAATILLAAACAQASAASPVAVFDFNGAPTALAPTSVADHLSATSASFGGGAFDGESLPAGALDFSTFGTGYLQFSITVENGWELDAQSLVVRAATLLYGSGIELRSSADSFASSLHSSVLNTGYPNYNTYTANLGTVTALQNLTGTTTFRLYGTSAFGDAQFAVDSLALSGELGPVAAPVPEPETYALMLAGLGVVGAMARRRRARAAG